MPKRDHSPLIIQEFMGLYDRGSFSSPPPNYMYDARNVAFHGSPTLITPLQSRNKFTNLETMANTGVKRVLIYEKASGRRFIYLTSTGAIKDRQAADATILTVASATGISGLTLNDRLYFTVHNKVNGIASEFIYVYDPSLSATARKIAGVKPGAGLAAAVSVTNGVIEPGQHVYAVSFITNTGHVTPPGSHVILTSPDPRKKTSLTGIPLGGASVTKRRIWMSQVVRHYDGNIAAIPLFFVGDINDNVTTIATVDAYDSQLISSADPYLDLLEEVPAGTWLSLFKNSVVSCGESAAPYAVRVSNVNEPEAFNSINGVREVVKFGGGVLTTRELNGNLHCWKLNSTYVIEPTSNFPIEWNVKRVSGYLGAGVYAVSEVANDPSDVDNLLLVANGMGLFVYDGHYTNILYPLSYVIENRWRTTVGSDAKLVVDPSSKVIYISGSEGSTTLLTCNYQKGLNFDDVKWSNWDFIYIGGSTFNLNDIHVGKASYDGGFAVYGIFNNDNKIKRISDIGDDVDGIFTVRMSFVNIDKELRTLHINSVKALANTNNGNFKLFVYDEITEDTILIPILSAPPRVVEGKFNKQGPRLIFGIVRDSAISGGYIFVFNILAFFNVLWQEAPQ